MHILFSILCLVTSVHDGDTVHCQTQDTIYKVRLVHIDAPEQRIWGCPPQPYATESTDDLKDRVDGKQVEMVYSGFDKYGRALGTLYLDGVDINQKMVQDGSAELYRGLPLPSNPYYQDELLAKEEQRGIWSLPDYESPRDYRARCR